MLNIVRINDSILGDQESLNAFLKDFAAIHNPKILVHGGGALPDWLAERLGIENGIEVKDAESMQLAAMLYAGLANKILVARLQAYGCDALGLSGADANIIPTVKAGAQNSYVGNVQPYKISGDTLDNILNEGLTPVFCPITHDGKGDLLYSDTDSVAAGLAAAMVRAEQVRLTYCIEEDGLYDGVNGDTSLIHSLSAAVFEEKKEHGTLPDDTAQKLSYAVSLVRAGVKEVAFKRPENLTKGIGTFVKA